jgi:predicted phosphodiesterase
MSDLKARLAAVEHQAELQDDVRPKKSPSGWEPGVVWDGTSGTITTDTIYEPPTDWSDLLQARGLDPERYQIVGDTIRWTSFDGWKRDNPDEPAYSTICYSYKAEIRLKTKTTPDLEHLYTDIRKAKKTPKPVENGDSTFVIALSDWQFGNRDGGGVEKQLQKIAELPDKIVDRLKKLRKIGYNIDHVLIAGLGDLVEGTCGHYPAQQFRIELDRREQTKVVRRSIRDIIMAVAPEAPKVTVTAVGGNHGENRGLNGKAFTTTGDNDDVAVFEQIAEIFQINPDVYGHVGFRLPLDKLTTSINLHGTIVAFTHGHLSKPAGNAGQAIWNWWEKQTMGRAHEGVADANILVTGHYHHLNIKEQQGRAVFVCPSLTPVGEYFQDTYGVSTRCGTLSFIVNSNGWSELALL